MRKCSREASLNNIERFDLYTAHILSVLYRDFPVARTLEAPAIVEAMKAVIPVEPGQELEANRFVGHTIIWLEKTGYSESVRSYANTAASDVT